MKNVLSRMMQLSSGRSGRPRLIVTTPNEQWHELGAMLVAAAAAGHGWSVTYLGPSLVAEEIVSAANDNRARAVALSIVYPEDAPGLNDELVRLRSLLPDNIEILAGGRAAPAYADALQSIGAIYAASLQALYAALDEIRNPREATAGT